VIASIRQWALITVFKHPIMTNREVDVIATLENPDEIRVSKTDSAVYLYYKSIGSDIVAAVAKHLNGEGFLITAYVTTKIKEGKRIYKKNGKD